MQKVVGSSPIIRFHHCYRRGWWDNGAAQLGGAMWLGVEQLGRPAERRHVGCARNARAPRRASPITLESSPRGRLERTQAHVTMKYGLARCGVEALRQRSGTPCVLR
jgi:hypothetical protein